VLVAVLGLLYNAASLFGVATGAVDQVSIDFDAPYLHAAFYVMSSICILFYVLLLVCGVQFIRLRSGLWWLFTTVLVMEVIFHFAVNWLWSHRTFGGSIAAATGISSGGLMFQFWVLFPLWAPVIVWLARRPQSPHAP
jgi:hypothetical protein